MTRIDLLLVQLSEECAEVAVEVSKALRFGPSEVQKWQPLSNAERVARELSDLFAIVVMLQGDGVLPRNLADMDVLEAKKAKVERWMEFSKECGRLET